MASQALKPFYLQRVPVMALETRTTQIDTERGRLSAGSIITTYIAIVDFDHQLVRVKLGQDEYESLEPGDQLAVSFTKVTDD